MKRLLAAALAVLAAATSPGAAPEKLAPAGPWWDTGRPFLTSSVDFSSWGPDHGLVVRGLLVRLPRRVWLCHDLDRGRIAGIWQTESDAAAPVTATSIPAISWDEPSRKAEPGTRHLPRPTGRPLPLRPVPDVIEDGARWEAIDLAGGGFRLILAGGTARWWEVAEGPGGPSVRRRDADGSTAILTVGEASANAAWQAPGPSPASQQTVTVSAISGNEAADLVVDRIPLPVPNPWRRRVRPAAMAFLPDGTAAIATIDGDVWTASGSGAPGAAITWRRFAGGLHEPQGLAVAGGRLHAFTRSGIVRLEAAPDGSCTAIRNFCQDIPQSGETREFPMDLVALPDGSFCAAKGGQQLTKKTAGAGRIYHISPDGRSVTEFASGLRQPYLGVDPASGLLTATDQQGHWVPATPIMAVRKGDCYGFPDASPDPAPPLASPLCWVPHEVNQSAAGQVWCRDRRMGPLADHLVHLAYFKPALFAVHFAPDHSQAGVVPLPVALDIPPLKAAIHPRDGHLHVCGFRIWGTDAPEPAGLVRIRPGRALPTWPADVSATPRGILLRFHRPLAPHATDTCTVRSWHYRRSAAYGSPHIRRDESPGEDSHKVHGLQLSDDARSLFVHTDPLSPVQQLRIDWQLTAADGTPLRSFACLTVHRFTGEDALPSGFAADWQPPASMPQNGTTPEPPPSAAAGKDLATRIGCLACHSTDGRMEGMKGPTWHRLFGSSQQLTDGSRVTIDDAYLRQSILDPQARVRAGFADGDVGMPPYAGILSSGQIESLLLFIRSLGSPPSSGPKR